MKMKHNGILKNMKNVNVGSDGERAEKQAAIPTTAAEAATNSFDYTSYDRNVKSTNIFCYHSLLGGYCALWIIRGLDVLYYIYIILYTCLHAHGVDLAFYG